ncbi:MAG: hypothetical protein U1E62_06990 [Alsobacter sp.]
MSVLRGLLLAVGTMLSGPLTVLAGAASCDVAAVISEEARTGATGLDPNEARHARRAHVTRDRHAPLALAESGGKVGHVEVARLLDREFARFDPDYLTTKARHRSRLDALKVRLDAAQGPGHWLYCSQQLYNDAEWLVEYTALWPRVTAGLNALEDSLSRADQQDASRQAADGSWGGCRDEFVFRVDSTVDALNGLNPDPVPQLRYPLNFLQAVGTPADVSRLIFSRLVSAMGASGIYGREEIASLTESLPQFLFKPTIATIARNNGAAFIEREFIRRHARLLDSVQNPFTGFWGPSLSVDGEILALPDLSMTFHIVSYRRGCIERWSELIETLLAIKELSYPFGWMHDGRITTHNAYDVVKLLAHGWDHASPGQKETASREIASMLQAIMASDVRPDGSVVFDPDYYETEAAAYYFAIAFLDEAGFWRPERRFWSENKHLAPEALSLCRAMKARVGPLAAQSSLAVGAMQRLQENCP